MRACYIDIELRCAYTPAEGNMQALHSLRGLQYPSLPAAAAARPYPL